METIRKVEPKRHSRFGNSRLAGLVVATDTAGSGVGAEVSAGESSAMTLLKRMMDLVSAMGAAVVIVFAILWAMPTSVWFDVRAVQILNAHPGESPRMVVDAQANIPTLLEWSVLVSRKTETGWNLVCSVSGIREHGPDTQVPVNVDLDWWTWPSECRLAEGQYVVRTIWKTHVFGIIAKDSRILSNVFTVS